MLGNLSNLSLPHTVAEKYSFRACAQKTPTKHFQETHSSVIHYIHTLTKVYFHLILLFMHKICHFFLSVFAAYSLQSRNNRQSSVMIEPSIMFHVCIMVFFDAAGCRDSCRLSLLKRTNGGSKALRVQPSNHAQLWYLTRGWCQLNYVAASHTTLPAGFSDIYHIHLLIKIKK